MAAGIVATSAFLAGCFPGINNGGNNALSSEIVGSEIATGEQVGTSESGWVSPETGSAEAFPGGLDDDGREPGEGDVMATSVDLKIEYNEKDSTHKGIVRGYDVAGNLLWTYETEEVYVGQVDNIEEIITTDNGYIFVVEGKIICLGLYTGTPLWTNSDYKGSGTNWTIDYEGKYLFLTGYFGPSLFVCDLQTGETVNRITSSNDEYYWAYKVTYVNEHQVDVLYESNEQTLSFDPFGPSEQ